MAIAGGIDSSYAAYCLKRDTHEVVGITFLFYACKREDERVLAAKNTCEQLEIEHHIIDARATFKEHVVDPFCKEFAKGAQTDPLSFHLFSSLLFSLLFEQAKKLNCKKIATGHFANITNEQSFYKDSLQYQLKTASDAFHDESYYLYGLTQSELSKIVFPLADIAKPVLRREAMKTGLVRLAPLAKRYDPFFLQDESLEDWAAANGALKCSSGPVIDVDNMERVIATHEGLAHYNIGLPFGEHHTSSCASDGEHPSSSCASFDEHPPSSYASDRYVLAKDVSTNTLYVGSKTLALKRVCQLDNVVWTSVEPIVKKRSCKVKLQFLTKAIPAQLVPQKNGKLIIVFNEPILEVPYGSDCVFYSDSLVLGGGRIVE